MPRPTMLRKALSVRLVAASFVWILGALLVAGTLLVVLFRSHIEQRFDSTLRDYLEELVAASEITPAGILQLTWRPGDPRFNRPHSGWYWEILLDGEAVARSDSLWKGLFPVDEPEAGGGAQIQHLTGPGGVRLRARAQEISFPDTERPYLFVIAGPLSDIEGDVRRFAGSVAITLTVLGIALLGVILVQVGFGLQPLRVMRRALADIRSGKSVRLPESFPREVQPVITELNALLDYNAALLERARTQAGNLAHSLKNPLTVLRNEAKTIGGKRGAVIRDQLDMVAESIDRQLARGRAAGAENVLGARAEVKDVVDDLRFSMSCLYRERGLEIRFAGLEGLVFQGDAQDLEEMLGNLLDNACKWAKCKIMIRGETIDGRLRITVEDDGPGIPQTLRAKVVRRGGRLDESISGSGLGLGIVSDIASLYHGSLELSESTLGGLAARLELPATV